MVLLVLSLAALSLGGTAAGLAYAADVILRRRHGLPPADGSEAGGRGVAAVALGPAAVGFAFAAVILLDPLVPDRPRLPGWVPFVVMAAVTHAVVGAAFYYSLTEVRAACPRGEVLLVSAAAAGAWVLCLWGGFFAAVGLLLAGHW